MTTAKELRDQLRAESTVVPAATGVPDSVYMWQAKVALSAAGLLDAANAAVAASGNAAVQMAWESAPYISRRSPSVAAVAAALNLTSQQVDDLFIAASVVQV